MTVMSPSAVWAAEECAAASEHNNGELSCAALPASDEELLRHQTLLAQDVPAGLNGLLDIDWLHKKKV